MSSDRKYPATDQASDKSNIPVPLSTLKTCFQAKLFNNNSVLPKIKVLVVEDNVVNQLILSGFLRKNNIPFTLISNGRDALKEWRKGGYQLILMDIQLPFISGIYCAKEIRRLENVNGISARNRRDFKPTPQSQSQSRPQTQPETNAGESQNNTSTETVTAISRSSTGTSTSTSIATVSINNNVKEDSPNPLTDETATDKLDVSKFKSPVIIVALTANSFTEDRDNALAAGCNDFLVKPVNLHWLGKKFAEWGCMQALINFDDWKSISSSNLSNNPRNQASNERILKQRRLVDIRLKRLLTQIQNS